MWVLFVYLFGRFGLVWFSNTRIRGHQMEEVGDMFKTSKRKFLPCAELGCRSPCHRTPWMLDLFTGTKRDLSSQEINLYISKYHMLSP